MLLLCIAPLAIGHAQRRGQPPPPEPDPLNHVGAWNCILYGDPARGDERVLFSFAPDGSTRMARPSEDVRRPWTPLSRWQVEEGQLRFTDSRTERRFVAQLNRPTLGGEWRTITLLGGWWCSQAEASVASNILTNPTGEPTAMTQPLIPEVMATPAYPTQAIREAKEGRVVVCFEVDPSGSVQDPQFVELTDEIFRGPSLDALMLSQYKGWSSGPNGGNRPACRSFVYRLDQIY